MALNGTSFANQIVSDICMVDFRRENTVLPIFMESAMSKQLLQFFGEYGPEGGFAAAINISRMVYTGASDLSPSSTDGYSTISSFPSSTEDPDLSAAYAACTTENQQFKIDKFGIGTHRLPAVHRLLNAAGGLIRENKLLLDIKAIQNGMEQGFIGDLISASTPASMSGETATNFALRTDSEANLLTDLGLLDAAFNRYNCPQADRILILPTSTRGKIMRYDHLVNSLILDRANSNLATAELHELMGMKLVFSNSFVNTESVGVAVHLDRAWFALPVGFIIEDLKSKDRLGDYTRVWTLAGWGTTGKEVVAYDGDHCDHAKEGIFAVTIS